MDPKSTKSIDDSGINVNSEVSQMNNFIRGAKKKSSLKTTKSSYKEVHQKLKSKIVGTVKMKNIKWDTEQIEKLSLEAKPTSNRKAFESANTKWKNCEAEGDEYLKKLNEINKTDATNELMQEVERKLSIIENEEPNQVVIQSKFLKNIKI